MSIYDVLKDKGPKGEKKSIKSMVHTKTHNGKHVITHKHHAPFDHERHDEVHMHGSMADVHDHMEKHAGTPAPGEPAGDMAGGAPQLTASPAPEAPAPGGMPQGGMPPAGM